MTEPEQEQEQDAVEINRQQNGTTEDNSAPGWLSDWGYNKNGKGVQEIPDEDKPRQK